MSLSNISLPNQVLQQMYQNVLVGSDKQDVASHSSRSNPIKFLGNNKRHVAILVNREQVRFLPDDELNFLIGILAACKLSMDDVAIINIFQQEKITYKTIKDSLQSEKIFLFGIPTQSIELPLDFPYYQIQSYNQQVYLTAPELVTLKDNVAEKKRLWLCLKQIFPIQNIY